MTLVPDFNTRTAPVAELVAATSPAQRRRFLEEANNNLFTLRSDQVLIDLLTDSGTGVMSAAQWAAMKRGDESYAGSLSYFRLAEVVKNVFGMPHMLPTHQGRIAERLLVESVIGKFPAGNGMIVPNNAHFDTTRHMIEASGAEAANLLIDDFRLTIDDCHTHSRVRGKDTIVNREFPGNIDTRKLEQLLQGRADDVPFVMVTVTCNSNGGQPVSLDNLRQVREICDRFGKMLFLDACRFAENAWFIRKSEVRSQRSEVSHLRSSLTSDLCPLTSVPAIVREMFDLADGAVMSTRKDGLCNVGGLLLMRDEHFYRKACNLCVLTEGFQMTYGSLPGRDLEAIAVGLQEAMDETYLAARIGQVQSLAEQLTRGGVKIVQPAGGHAVFLDAEDFCPHLSRVENPAHSLACAIYEHSGIRCTRIGSALKNERCEPMEIVRLAVPRRRYSQLELEYVARSIVELKSRASAIQPIKAALPASVRMDEALLATA